MDSVISTATMAHTFQCLEKGQPVSDAAHTKNLLYAFVYFFRSLLRLPCCNQIREEIETESALLHNSRDNIHLPLLQSVLDTHGRLHQPDPLHPKEILFELNGLNFVMVEDNSTLFIYENFRTDGVVVGSGVKVHLENMSVSSLKIAALKTYLKEQRGKGELADLSEFDFAGMDLSEVDFNGTVISGQNFTQIVAGRGKLNGAKFHSRTALTLEQINTYLTAGGSDLRGTQFVDNERNASNIAMGKAAIDLILAMSLIEAGANPTAVMIRYLETAKMETELNSKLFIETWLTFKPDRTIAHLKQTEIENLQRKKLKDYSYIDLNDFPLDQIDTDKVVEAGVGLEYAIGISNLTPLGRLRNLVRRTTVPPTIEQLILFADDLESLHAREVVLISNSYGVHGELFAFKKCQFCAQTFMDVNKNRKDFFWNMLMAFHPGITSGVIEHNVDFAVGQLIPLLSCSDHLKNTLISYLKGTDSLPYGIRLRDFLTSLDA